MSGIALWQILLVGYCLYEACTNFWKLYGYDSWEPHLWLIGVIVFCELDVIIEWVLKWT